MKAIASAVPKLTRRHIPLSRVLKSALGYLLLTIGFVAFVFPFLTMFTGSFKRTNEIVTTKLTLFPKVWVFGNYAELFRRLPFERNLFNSFIVATSHTLLVLFLCSLAGFTFAKLRFPGREQLLILLVSTMMIPGLVGLVPSFVIMSRLHWLDTYWPLIIPGAANAFGIFMMRQYCAAIPDELIDAARIDGCSSFRIIWAVAVPIIKPAFAVLGFITFMGSWNDYFWPLIVLKRMDMYTVQVALATLKEQGYVIPYGVLLAGAMFGTLPTVVLFLVFQRWFISGILSGALKG
jgi:ABC-type glycerol-3-phosphate transport system permease component